MRIVLNVKELTVTTKWTTEELLFTSGAWLKIQIHFQPQKTENMKNE